MTMPKTVDPEKNYQVQLSRACEIAPGVWARPGDVDTVTGAVLVSIKDFVIDAVPVE